jgi:demethylmenaquinone methyltransferase/2-methoxy-6-polyprenyl-1,4-benzoquinol methylase
MGAARRVGEDETMDEVERYYTWVRKEFNLVAPFYDFITKPFAAVRNRVAEFVDPSRDLSVLDVGTGTGAQALAFANKGCKVTGIDLSEGMLKVARKKNVRGRLNWVIADATNLPFANHRFEISSVSLVLHEMPSQIREKTLKEVVRVTMPGGTILIVDYGLPEGRISRFFIYHLVKLYESKWYGEFMRFDLRGFLQKLGVYTVEWFGVWWGVGKVLRGSKDRQSSSSPDGSSRLASKQGDGDGVILSK